MKLLQVLRLIRAYVPEEMKDVFDRVIDYMEIVDRILDLIVEVLPDDEGSPVATASSPKVVELRALVARLEDRR